MCAGGGYYRVVGPVVLPLVVPVGPAHQRALQHVNVGAGARVVAPPARLPRARARGGSADTSRGRSSLDMRAPVMRSLWGTVPEAADVAVTTITKGIVYLLLCKPEVIFIIIVNILIILNIVIHHHCS